MSFLKSRRLSQLILMLRRLNPSFSRDLGFLLSRAVSFFLSRSA